MCLIVSGAEGWKSRWIYHLLKKEINAMTTLHIISASMDWRNHNSLLLFIQCVLPLYQYDDKEERYDSVNWI